MEHFYQKIDGFFTYEDLYNYVIDKLSDNAHVVEVGAYKGRSTAYLATLIFNSGKKIKFDVVDTWDGTDGTTRPAWSDYQHNHGDIFNQFKNNLAPVIDIINPIKMLSFDACSNYEDKSLDFVFIDANHSYEGVKKDILGYLPKMKSGSIFAGHDYNPISWPGVVQAVHELFPTDKIKIMGECWLIHL